MSKYQHMSADELANHIELFGTDDERIIMDKLHQEADYEDCPYCESHASDAEQARAKIRNALAALED